MADDTRQGDCTHQQFRADVDVNRFEDTGAFMADIRVQCIACGEPFRFLGVDAGLRWDRPTCSIDGRELHAPIEPEGEPRLQSRASYHMPAIPTRH